MKKIRKAVCSCVLNRLEKINLSGKLLVMQIFCVILPIFITDAVIIGIAVTGERQLVRKDMENTAGVVKYLISDHVNSAALFARNIYSNRYVNEFISQNFASELDYYNSQMEFIRDSLYPISMHVGFNGAVIYADNKGIVNGGYFNRISMAEGKDWYKRLMEGNSDVIVDVEYAQKGDACTRKFFLAQKMDYYNKGKGRDVLYVEMDYSGIWRQIVSGNYKSKVYVCDGDAVLFSNDGKGGLLMPFDSFEAKSGREDAVTSLLNLYGSEYVIYVLPPETTVLDKVRDKLPWILLLAGL
ncbi:MAG: cache domain-containing protein, partial [Lachnospiraceae bacterium]|nr:cache domain-containing protein [Lachnospiraceae bacterium]